MQYSDISIRRIYKRWTTKSDKSNSRWAKSRSRRRSNIVFGLITFRSDTLRNRKTNQKASHCVGRELRRRIEKNLERLILKKSEILKAKGITAEMLDPPPKCSKCGDTGLVNGKPCSCVISLCVTDSSVIGFGFEDCDFAIFPDEERDRIMDVYKTAKGFCDKFPTTKKLNFIFMGKCGSGKTFAASCMAKAISDKGYSVIMLSSFAFANRMLKYHVALSSEKLQYLEPLLDCDLLVIDDLGSENIIKTLL